MFLRYNIVFWNELRTLRTVRGHSRIFFTALLTLFSLYSTFSTVLSNPVPLTESNSMDESTLLVSEMSFSEKLENPCALMDTSANLMRPSESSEVEQKVHIRNSLLNELRGKTLLLKDNAQTILRTSVLEDCSRLELPSVAIIPSSEELADQRPVEVFRLFYTSLMNHTAHVYFISDQLQRHNSDARCGANTLTNGARSLASHMRELMCVLRLCTKAFQDGDPNAEDPSISDSTSQILNEQLIDQPLCSRRSVRDCQTIGSTVSLLRALSTYLRRTISVDSS